MSILSQLKDLILESPSSWGIVTNKTNILTIATEKGLVTCASFEPNIQIGNTVLISSGYARKVIENPEKVYWVP